MGIDLFRGERVHLTAENPDTLGEVWSRWNRNSEFMRLLDTDPAILWSKKRIQEWNEKELEKDRQEEYFFTIRTLQEDRLIGFAALFEFQWNHGDPWVAIGLGEPDTWGKGFGSEAMHLVLRYAFTELNVHRVTLCVFDYNERAIRSYEKVGFKHEGRVRGEFLRSGSRWDMFFMGILREEWLRDHAEG
jgi:RimJ/RimL family protein N-acetyltransferase